MIPREEWNYALGPPFLVMNERVDATQLESNWEHSTADVWTTAQIVSTKSMMLPVLEPWKLPERSIPPIPEVERFFDNVVTCSGSLPVFSWKDLIHGKSSLHIPANETVVVEVQVAELTTGFLNLKCLAGSSATIKVLCAECYEQPMERSGPGAIRRKGDRTDNVRGQLYGPEDFYTTRNGINVFEPFWVRTFRYIQLTISTNDECMNIKSFSYRESRYPLGIQSSITGSHELEKMWKISLNTLQNCMHETYEDCPYYEQNQFAMDSRIQILFTYQLSRDDRLARKCMQEFYASRRDDGLLQAQFPSPGRCVSIPQFSLFWVLMIHDHMRYFNDRRLIKQYLGTIDGILDHFDARIYDKGLVGRFCEESWPFVDWVKEWHEPEKGLHGMGIPQAYWEGAATYNSLVYAFTLNHAADMCDCVARHDTAKEYRDRAAALNSAVNQHCFDGDFYTDGPGAKARSQHSQVFAILSGAIKGAAASELMRKTLKDSSLAQCSYAMSFYLLRAAEKAGVYQEMFPLLIEPWRKMMANNLTTWAEDDLSHRSDCHGWSASPLYETAVRLFGLSPAEPGYKSLRLEPSLSLLPPGAEGTFVTGGGHVKISWTAEQSFIVETTYDCNVDFVHNGSYQIHALQKDVPLHLLGKDNLPSLSLKLQETCCQVGSEVAVRPG
jgi:alpha-L-rhamnosidase